MSMKVFKDNKWFAKDGMSNNPKNWCGTAWPTDGETDVDWVNIPQSLEYDANLKSLTTKFYRKLVGSSEDDYTFKLN